MEICLDVLIPFRRSHKLKNNSAAKQGMRIAGYISFTNAGKRNQMILLEK